MPRFVTRFAPSPTGRLHLGHAFSALTAFDAAREAGGRFLLRIEDIDAGRVRPEFEAAIYDDLAWLGIVWETPARRQSEHRADYLAALTRLRAEGLIYRCFRTRKEAAQASASAPHGPQPPFRGAPLGADDEAQRLARGEAFAWRLSLAQARRRLGGAYDRLTFHDLDHDFDCGEQVARPDAAGDVVLARKDVGVAYHLACVVDDALQGVTHVIRGEDLREAVSIQRLLQALLDLPTPAYRNHPLVLDERGRRLAKRDGAVSLAALREAGATAEDIRARLASPRRASDLLSPAQPRKEPPMSDTPAAASLQAYLDAEIPGDAALSGLILAVAEACVAIAGLVRRGALADVLGAAGAENVQGEAQKKLDVISNDMLIAAADHSGQVRAIASEEEDDILAFPAPARRGPHLLLFDPLDGSSNIDVNVSIGTIFSVLPAPDHVITAADFLQPGRRQLAAGYAVYGPQTTLVVTIRRGVAAFTLDPQTSQWVRSPEPLAIPRATKEFAINMSNRRHWAPPVRAYIDECLEGREGPRGKDFNMRWIASMVADVHRILTRGGVFLYPWDRREPDRPGKLRLMYEANPLSLVVERAGGAATDANSPILDIQPAKLHQRVSVILGSAEEVERVTAAHAA